MPQTAEEVKEASRLRTRAWVKANPERKVAMDAAYRAANRERLAAQNAAWRAANRDVILAKKADYRRRNGEKVAAWKRENADRVNLLQNRRRAVKAGNGAFRRTPRDRHRQLARQWNECFYCHDPLAPGRGTHEDHIIPIKRGGRDSVGNIVYACSSCNLQKAASTVMEWRLQCR